MSSKRIGLKEVRALGPGETIWDAAVPSFGARRQKGPAVAYVLKFRTAEGRQRWHTIGRHGAPWTPEMAREEARRLLGEGPMSGFRKIWDRMAKLGPLPGDVTPHVLRHSFASLASDLGYSEPTIAAMVGHKGRTITSRYVHSADAVLLAAADTVADRTAGLMGEAKSGVIIEYPNRVRLPRP